MPERIDAVLSGVLREAAKQHGPLFTVQRRWRNIAGATLARHTQPVSLRRGKLVVRVERPGDGFALRYQRLRILARANAATKGQVEEIVIRPGG